MSSTKAKPTRVQSTRGKEDKHKDDKDKKPSLSRQASLKTAKKKIDVLQKLIFDGDLEKIKAEVVKRGKSKDFDVNEHDSHGNSPLHLAIQLRKIEVVRYLLSLPKISPTKENLSGWTPLQEAVATNDLDLIQTIYKAHLIANRMEYTTKLPLLAQTLKGLSDFTLELKWSLSTWIPLVSKYCPSDSYVIHKRGSSIRLDSTLVGFENCQWIRGNVSVIFNGDQPIDDAFIFLHHDEQRAELLAAGPPEDNTLYLQQDIEEIRKQPLVTLKNSTTKLHFTPLRNWSGVQKTSVIAGYNCQLFNIEGLAYSLDHRQPEKSSPTPLPSYDQYNTSGVLLQDPTRHSSKTFACSAHLAQDFPLQVSELLPVLEVLAPQSETIRHIQQVFERDFPENQFPLKIEIPAFPTVTGIAAFESFKQKTPDAELFQIPSNYKKAVKF